MCHVSHVMCHVSQVSHVTSGGASQSRVFYQRGLGVGETIFLKTRLDKTRNGPGNGKRDGIRDEKWETRLNSRRDKGNNGKGDKTSNIIFQRKTRIPGKKQEKQRKKTGGEKTENYKKYRNETRQDFHKTRF